ncbi:MAG: CTP synthase [Dehalococcoidia bacterium]|nr:CTP synthase [Dehalococcoidia bacterium]
MSKYVFVTGGVLSSVGKGVSVASLGRILKSRGFTIGAQKLDPYLNAEPGLMSPAQHGELFLTKDGAAADLDLGHYERFIGVELSRYSSVTAGQVYRALLEKERRGDYLGGTIQVVPQLTDEIKRLIRRGADANEADIAITEVGGTVGDIEGQPFLEAIRQMRNEEGRDNVLYVHVTFLPYIGATHELKTKPTQHSVNELRRIGIQPDVILCRSDFPVAESIRDKISLFCDVEKDAVVSLETSDTIYEVPLVLEAAGIGDFICSRLGLKAAAPDLEGWRSLVDRLKQPRDPIHIAIVGEHVQLEDAYYSVREALVHAALVHDSEPEFHWIDSKKLTAGDCSPLRSVQGIVIPGSSHYESMDGLIVAAAYARANGIPFLGIDTGMHAMVVEHARSVAGLESAASSEYNAESTHPVVERIPNGNGSGLRQGTIPCRLIEGTRAAAAYGAGLSYERHRHSHEFNGHYRGTLRAAGLIPSGVSADDQFVDIVETQNHPWMVGCQFHAEFKSRPDLPHPLFVAFVDAAKHTLVEGAQPSLPIT